MKDRRCLTKLAGEDAGHHGCALGDTFVGVELIVGLEAELFLEPVLDPRDSGRAADQDDFVDFVVAKISVQDCLPQWLLNLLQRSCHEFFELGLLEAKLEVLVSGKRQHSNLRLKRCAELLFGLLANGLQAGARTLVITEIGACLLFELLDAVRDQDFIEVPTSQIHVTIRGEHVDQAVLDVEHGHVKGAATEVKHNDVHLLVGVVEAAGHCRSSRLIDDALAVEASDFARMPRRLFLRLIEVRRHCDDGFFDLALQPVLCHLLHGVEHLGRDLLRGHSLLDTI